MSHAAVEHVSHRIADARAFTRDDLHEQDWRMAVPGECLDELEALVALLDREPVPTGALSPDELALEAIQHGLEMTLDVGMLLEANVFGVVSASEDMREGLQAFLDKRKPEFKNR